MADQGVPRITAAPSPRRPLRTFGKWAGILLGVIALLIGAIYLGINSDVGRRYVVRQINNLETVSGLDIDVGRIEGSIYGKLTIHDLTLKDPKGTFFVAPVAEIDWRPFSYFRNHVDIKSITIPRARLYRAPQLKPGDPNAPLLPDLDIDIGRVRVERLLVDAAVTGSAAPAVARRAGQDHGRPGAGRAGHRSAAGPGSPAATGSGSASMPFPKPIGSI
jgi:translocation and assembly module TamB